MNDLEHPCNQGGRCAFWLKGRCSLIEERPTERCDSYINLIQCEYADAELCFQCDAILKEQREKQQVELAPEKSK